MGCGLSTRSSPERYGSLEDVPNGGPTVISAPVELDPVFQKLFNIVLVALYRGDRQTGIAAISAHMTDIQQSSAFIHATFVTLRYLLDVEEQIRSRPFDPPQWDDGSIPGWLSRFCALAAREYDTMSQHDVVAEETRLAQEPMDPRIRNEFEYLRFLTYTIEHSAVPREGTTHISDLEVLFHALAHSYILQWPLENAHWSPEEVSMREAIKSRANSQFAYFIDWLRAQGRIDVLLFSLRLRHMWPRGQTYLGDIADTRTPLKQSLVAASICAETKHQRAMCRWQGLQLDPLNSSEEYTERVKIAAAFAECGDHVLAGRVVARYFDNDVSGLWISYYSAETFQAVRDKISPHHNPWTYARLSAAQINKLLLADNSGAMFDFGGVMIDRFIDMEKAERIRMGDTDGSKITNSGAWNFVSTAITTVNECRRRQDPRHCMVVATYAGYLWARSPPHPAMAASFAQMMFEAHEAYAFGLGAWQGLPTEEFCRMLASSANMWYEENIAHDCPAEKSLEKVCEYMILRARFQTRMQARAAILGEVERGAKAYFNKLVEKGQLSKALSAFLWIVEPISYNFEGVNRVEDMDVYPDLLRVVEQLGHINADLRTECARMMDIFEGLLSPEVFAKRRVTDPPRKSHQKVYESFVGKTTSDGTFITPELAQAADRCHHAEQWATFLEGKLTSKSKRIRSDAW